MNKKFLYKKMSAHTVGFLDDSDNDDVSWMFDDSLVLEKKLKESPIDELIIELIDIFKEGNPNASKLIASFGFSYNDGDCKANVQGNMIIRKYNKIKRINKDIVSIEMHIEEMNDKTLIIRNLYLYCTNLPSIKLLKNKINEVYSNISYGGSEGLIICEKECNIIIIKGN